MNPIKIKTSLPPTMVSPDNVQQQQRQQQDIVQLARKLRRIKRRLLLEQCGVSVPPYALQSIPHAIVRSSSTDSSDSTIEVGVSKTTTTTTTTTAPLITGQQQQQERVPVTGSDVQVPPALPCVE